MASERRRTLIEWDEDDVHYWLSSSLGLSNYETSIKENGIGGDVLATIDPDSLKELGISVGHRLTILKAVYHLKLQEGIPVGPDDYVPPSEAVEETPEEKLSLEKLMSMIKDQEERIQHLERENERLHEGLQMCLEESVGTRSTQRKETGEQGNGGLRKQPSFKWAQFVRPARSPTRAPDNNQDLSPRGSPQALEHDISNHLPKQPKESPPASDRPAPTSRPSNTAPIPVQPPAVTHLKGAAASTSSPRTPTAPPGVADATDIRSFKVSLDDPAWKVLPAALKKYKINNDDWQNYAMFICYGNTERCLSYDEKPLLLFQKLKDAKKNPVFMLKHIKDIRSPIAVAQQKQQARMTQQAASSPLNGRGPNFANGAPAPAFSKSTAARVQGASAPSKVQVLLSGTPPISTDTSSAPQWPEVMSPLAGGSASDTHGASGPAATGSEQPRSRTTTEDSETNTHGGKDGQIVSTAISYAVAIYPYLAEQADEFDVAVNDTFIILSRARGWWVVQRDPTGTGQVETDGAQQGWVPAGCLLETSVPVASAIAEATASAGASAASPMFPKTPILPLSIVSTSFPGIALMEYHKKGDEELDLRKDDLLRVFKRYNHWSYAVKQDGGDRGWVPSWFIGKVGANPTPPTPNPNAPSGSSNAASGALESDLRHAFGSNGLGPGQTNTDSNTPATTASQLSPISPGFGSMSMSRTTATMI